MNWKNEAINDLGKLRKQENALANIPEQIKALQGDLVSCKVACTDRSPVQGGGSVYEDNILNNIVKREKLKTNFDIVSKQVMNVHAALSKLDEKGLRVLEVLVIDRQGNGVNRLMQEMNYEKSQVYRLKDKALYDFTIAMYGLADI